MIENGKTFDLFSQLMISNALEKYPQITGIYAFDANGRLYFERASDFTLLRLTAEHKNEMVEQK